LSEWFVNSFALSAVLAVVLAAGCVRDRSGEALFRENCSSCHPRGENLSRCDKGLKQADLLKNNIRSAEEIVAYLRKPGPDMPVFNEQSLPRQNAVQLAEYILQNSW
jgi:cytochrome c6